MAVIDISELRARLAAGATVAGLDLGTKTIGVAVSDPGLSFAHPRPVITRRKFTLDAQALLAALEKDKAGAVVIGLPVNMDGSEGPRAQATRAFVRNIVVEERGTLADLLTTTHTWATPAVADYYGASHPGEGEALVALDPGQRGGLLTLGAWLVSHGKKGRDNVVRRGMGIFRDAMCNEIEPLDIDLEAAEKELVGADATVAEIAEARGSDPVCGTCHRTSDPVGLAFEGYAGDGTWQTTYPDGNPVVSAVTLEGVDYDGPVGVAASLAEDLRFQHCLVQRFGHFVMGASFGDPITVRASREAFEAFVASDGSFEELLVAIVRDRAFIERNKQP